MDRFSIKEVWANNLEEEMTNISRLVEKYPYVAMDTEFPGFIAKSAQSSSTTDEARYHIQCVNVNILKIIQIGITLGDGDGNLATPVCTWQFNFKFSLNEELYSSDAISLLRQADIDFLKFQQDGIEVKDFAPLFFASGLVMNENVIWVSFHSGYDFAYLLKIVTNQPLPSTQKEFFVSLRTYFPQLYDIKYIMFVTDQKICGLQEIADDLNVQRYGRQHQAGSDSFVTLLVYYEFMKKNFNGIMTNDHFKNNLFGLSNQ